MRSFIKVFYILNPFPKHFLQQLLTTGSTEITISLKYVEHKPVFKPFKKVLNRAIKDYYSSQNRAKHYRAVLQYTLYIDSLCTFTFNKKVLICFGILFQIYLKINSSSFIIFFWLKYSLLRM